MTKRDWLKRERQPYHCGINARRHLKLIVKPRGDDIDRRVNLNAVSAAIGRLTAELKALRA